MKSIFHFSISLFLLVFLLLVSLSELSFAQSPTPPPAGTKPQRIISLAPSITETLFALDLGDRVVGVTRYCDYPPEALAVPRVGGYLDVNYEAALAADPDLVILLKEHQEARVRFERFGIEVMAVDHSKVAGILDSIESIGRRCAAREEGIALRRKLEERIDRIQGAIARATPRPLAPPPPRSTGDPRPTVMVAVGRSLESGSIGEVFVSGRDGFYDDLIRLGGGVNAYSDDTLKFPALSAEGIARLNPQVIIEMIPDLGDPSEADGLMERWRSIPGLDAAANGKIHILGKGYVVVPGPRFILLLEDMARVIHPDVPWDQIL
jgi:iron complex transport system substrate-binding protein